MATTSDRPALLVRWGLALLLGWGLSGCSKSESTLPARYPTRGVLTYNGKAPKNATVIFHALPLSDDWRVAKPQATVGEDGSFEMSCFEPKSGAMAGEYAVTVVWYPTPGSPDLFGGRFNNPKNPVAKVTVKEGENIIPPVKLTGPTINPASSAKKAGPSGNPGE